MYLLVKIKKVKTKDNEDYENYYGMYSNYENLIDENGLYWQQSQEFPFYQTVHEGIPADYIFVDGACCLVIKAKDAISQYIHEIL